MHEDVRVSEVACSSGRSLFGGRQSTLPRHQKEIGEGLRQAIEMAREALVAALDFYFDDRREVPQPSRIKKGQLPVELAPSVAAKVLLLNEMIKQKVRPAELARRMGASPQEVSRLTQLTHATKIDGIDAALHALGKRLDVRVARA